MTVSHWRRVFSLGAPGDLAAAGPGRRDPLPCDLVVIGAGIAGLSAALHAERRGLSVRVVERHQIGWGASTRNAGFLMRGAADHYADAVRLYGRERAKEIWRWTEENLAMLRGEGIERLSTYQRVPSALLALNAEQADELRAARSLMLEDGFDAPWQESGDDSAWRSGRIVGALVNPGDAAINPVELLAFLAGKLRHPVLEGEEVYDISPPPRGRGQSGGLPARGESTAAAKLSDAEQVLIHTTSLTLSAPRVLVCTNAYVPLLFPQMTGKVVPRRGQMLAISNPPTTSPTSGRVRLDASYYANHGSEYFRQTSDGTIVVGGCRTYHADREVGYDDVTTENVQRDIERFAADMLGHDLPPDWQTRTDGAGAITARWAGTMGFSETGLPIIAPIPGLETDRVWFCGGFTGHGMSMACRAAKEAVERMAGA